MSLTQQDKEHLLDLLDRCHSLQDIKLFIKTFIVLTDLVKEEVKIERRLPCFCLKCGKAFIPNRNGQKFCPPEKIGIKSNCQNNYEQMKHRARKQVNSGEKTIEEIVEWTGRPLEEIQGWFDV